MNYVFVNPEKERFAREAIKSKGVPRGYRGDPRDGSVNVAHCALYHKSIEEDPKMSDEDRVIYIYRGLGGNLEEYPSADKAKERADKLKAIRVKQARKDAAL